MCKPYEMCLTRTFISTVSWNRLYNVSALLESSKLQCVFLLLKMANSIIEVYFCMVIGEPWTFES